MCGQNNDSQEHALEFHIVKQHLKPGDINILCVVRCEVIFPTIDKQVPITKLSQTIIEIRQKQAPHGIIVDHLINTQQNILFIV